ncbi:MAG: hypothetical protein P9L92_20445 [Candidatus Electryonea clarkiae]|nr:hypothetical protein [Candidatus Electryonea clarkiae]MDP8288012.1 hypothetical protein [Candidatus Electryonea clarkiae]
MDFTNSSIALSAIFLILLLIIIAKIIIRKRFPFDSYLTYTWTFFLGISVAEFISFAAGIWIIAVLSFIALKEYLSLIDIRLQDRIGILGAYLSIPFMFYFIQIQWYGMFIIAIPVYSFLAIPLLVSLGGRETQGTVFSIGAIDFGLFLYVFCTGHIAYLLHFGIWKPALLILGVAICDKIAHAIKKRIKSNINNLMLRFIIPLPITVLLSMLTSEWTGIPFIHSIILGSLIPVLVIMGQHTGDYIKADIGVEVNDSSTRRGKVLDNLKSYLFTAPVVFHYIRFFLT